MRYVTVKNNNVIKKTVITLDYTKISYFNGHKIFMLKFILNNIYFQIIYKVLEIKQKISF